MSTCRPSISIVLGDAEDPLTISEDCSSSGMMWTELILPEWELRYNYAPPSNYVPGNVLLSAVEDAGAVGMRVVVRGTSLSDMETQKALLTNALRVWPGEFRVEATDQSGTTVIGGPWQSFPTVPQWGGVEPGTVSLYLDEAAIALPVNPTGAP